MQLSSQSLRHQQPIPEEFAFCQPGPDSPCVLSANRNPDLSWCDAPPGTRSFALICVDPDVPSVATDVNQSDREIADALPRVDFVHWLMANIPSDVTHIEVGACSDGITARGKAAPSGPKGSVQGRNDYTAWFAGDPEMDGLYLGYDGPCPPFNDAKVHRYFFRLFALDVAQLDLPRGFGMAELLRAMQGHVIAETALYGTYTLNPRLR